MVLHAAFNQGIQLMLNGSVITIQATVEKGQMRYWVGKPDEVAAVVIQCRTSNKAPIGARHPAVRPIAGRPPQC